MKVSTQSWHWRVFLRWEQRRKRYERFMADSPQSYKPFRRETLDLCRYTRIVLLWSPLRWFFQREGVKPWWSLPIALALALLAGLVWVFFTHTQDALIIAGGIAGLLAWFWGLHILGERQKAKKAERAGLPPKPPGLIRSYVKAKKRRICPLIEIDERNAA